MTERFRVLLTDRAWPDSTLESDILSEIGAVVVEAPRQDEATLAKLATDVDGIGMCWAPVTETVIRNAPRCRIIARFGIGLDNIHVPTATELGIPVTNVPDYCAAEVSDHALGLLLALARRIAFFHHRTKQGEYDLSAAGTMRRLHGQVLGLVGFGRIAQALYPKARALGLTVVAHTPSANDYRTGCPMVSFNSLLETSDFISLHLPLSARTRHLFGRAAFERLKPSCYLLNTSRGPLVDPEALWAALRSGTIAGVALDVFDPEPPDLSSPLYRDERVIVTPHVAFFSEESVRDLRVRASRQIADALQGLRPENVVNPQVFEERR